MENNKNRKRNHKLIWAIIAAIAAGASGCAISINIQKNNNNSEQSVKQENNAHQENDSTTFNGTFGK